MTNQDRENDSDVLQVKADCWLARAGCRHLHWVHRRLAGSLPPH